MLTSSTHKAELQAASGDTDGALGTYKRAHELAPNSAPILSRYVTLLKTTKNFSDERDSCCRALSTAILKIPL